MQVVAVPKDFYGQFYRGDSYIILSVSDFSSLITASTLSQSVYQYVI